MIAPQINQNNAQIINTEPKQLPIISYQTTNLLTGITNSQIPSSKTLLTLPNQIHSLKKTQIKLQDTKDHDTRYKIIACLKVAALVVLVGIAVLSFLAIGGLAAGATLPLLPAIGITVGVFGGIILEVCLQVDSGSELGFSSPSYIVGPGFVLPLVEAFTRESRLQKSVDEQVQALRKTLELPDTAEANEIFTAIQKYYEEHAPALIEKLDENINTLEQMQNSEMQIPTLARNQAHYLGICKTAKEELLAVQNFYKQFATN